MKVIQRIPRTLVRAVSAGAVMVAAALPLAAAGVAGAATPATLDAASLSATSTNVYGATATATFATSAMYASSVSPSANANLSVGTAYPVVDTTTGHSGYLQTGTTLTENTSLALTTTAVTVTGTGPYTLTASSLASTVYAGETLTLKDSTPATPVDYTVVATATTAASSGSSAITVSLASGSLTTSDSFSVTAAASQTLWDFNKAAATGGTGDTLSFTTIVTGYNPTGYPTIGQGGSGTLYIFGTGFQFNGAVPTVTSNAPGMTFSGASETPLGGSGYGYVQVSYSTTAATTFGFYNLTVADGNGTTSALANAFYVDAAPTVTSIAPASVPQGVTQAVTVTGTNFATSGTLTLALTASDGTQLQVSSVTDVNSTTLTASVTALTKVGSAPATVGSYSATIANPDGGTSTTASVFSVTGFGISSASPSYVPVPGSASEPITVTLTGTGFSGGSVLVAYDASVVSAWTPGDQVSWYGGAPTVTASSITVPLVLPSGTAAGQLSFEYVSSAGVTASYLNGVGIGQAAANPADVVTVTSIGGASAPLVYGAVPTISVNGTGFAPGAEVSFTVSGTATPDNLTCGSTTFITTTQLLCVMDAIDSNVLAGPADVTVTNYVVPGTAASASASGTLPAGVTVAGPVITATTPAVLGQGTSGAITSMTLTGSGFPTTGTLTATFGGLTNPTNTVTVTSATSATVAFTNAAGAYATTTTPVSVVLTATGSTTSPEFDIPVGAAISVGKVVYNVANTAGVGIGATSIPVTITGTGFLPGASVSFATGSGATATVTAVSPTAISATVAVTSTGSASQVATWGVTVTNANGGTASNSVPANGLTVDAAPLGSTTVFSAVSVIAGAPAATITVTGGNLSAATTVASSSTLLTLGTPSYSTATGTYSFTASGPAITGTAPVGLTLTFTNPDGGVSTQGFDINPEPTVTGTYYVPTFSTNLEVPVTGSGFQSGITATSSNSAYTVYVAGVNGTGTVVTLLVTTSSAATSGTSSNVTLTNPDGSTVTFALNGGPAPTSTKTAVAFRAIRVVGAAFVGKTVDVGITGTGFYGAPTIRSNSAGVRAWATHDNGHLLTVRVVVAKNAPRGVHVFTITLKNGKRTTVKYNQR